MKASWRKLFCLCFSMALFFILSDPHAAWGQVTSARLWGVVTDSTGSLVAGTRVTVKNTGTGLTQTVVTDSTGVYQFPLLPPGEYTLKTEAAGFASRAQNGLVLSVGESATLNLKLQLGAAHETFTVTGRPEQMNTT
jgi:Carboxypeptidase regulatory-like domain